MRWLVEVDAGGWDLFDTEPTEATALDRAALLVKRGWRVKVSDSENPERVTVLHPFAPSVLR